MGLQLVCKLSGACERELQAMEAERSAIRALIPSGLERYFAGQARIFSTQGSAAIEGHDVELDRAASIVTGAAAPRGHAELAVHNLGQAQDVAYQLSRGASAEIDSGTIRSLNAVLQQGASGAGAATRGIYRGPDGPNYAVRANRGSGALLYEPPTAADVPELMAELVAHIRRWRATRSGPVAAALTHFALVTIHPFENGNGRTARLLSDMVLDLTGWSMDRMLSVSAALHDSGDEYFSVLQSAQGRAFKRRMDASAFVEYQVRQLRRAMEQLRQSAQGLTQLMDELRETTDHDRETMLLLWYLGVIGPISPVAYASLIGGSAEAAETKLAALSKADLVHRVDDHELTRYDLAEHLWERAQWAAEPPALEVGG